MVIPEDIESLPSGFTLVTNRPTDGTTDNASMRATEGVEYLNIDWIYGLMSSVNTRYNGPLIVPFNKKNNWKLFDAVSEGRDRVNSMGDKVQDIVDEAEAK